MISRRFQSPAPLNSPRRVCWMLGLAIITTTSAFASPPSRNNLGAKFTVLSKGVSSTVQITLRPKTSFDTVTVEAGSGATGITPPCTFADVVRGGTYECSVQVTQKASEASLTLNVVGQRVVNTAKPKLVEVSHFTLLNEAFVTTSGTTSSAEKPLLLSSPNNPSKQQ